MTDDKKDDDHPTAMEMLQRQEEARRRLSKGPSSIFGRSPLSPPPDVADAIARARKELGDQYFVFYDAVMESPNARSSGPKRPDEKKVEKWLVKLDHTIGWDNVIGAETAKLALRGAIEDAAKDPELFKFYGMTPPRGLMLYGPPGNGKTLLAKAAAKALADTYGKTDAQMLLVSGPELQSKWFGQTEEYIRDIFVYAREYAAFHKHPLVVFMDEADSLLRSREGRSFTDDIVSQFLSEMDGLRATDAFFILATNRPNDIDEAFLRDGRIDRKVKVGRIIREDVTRLLIELLKPGVTTWARNGVSLKEVVDRIYSPELLIRVLENPDTNISHHFNYEHIISGAMVEGLVKRAKTIAFQRDRLTADRTHYAHPDGVTTADFIAAVDQSYAEEKGLHHPSAVQEFVEDVALPAEQKLKQAKWN